MNQQMKSVAENHFKVRGRWYRKAAYLIDSIEQGIRLPDMRIEGDFTIQAWIYPDLFESSMSVIMNTERFGPDRLHWQFNRGGKVKVGYGAQKIPKETSGSKLEQGKWNQVSMTYDSTNKILRSFVNGNLVSQTKRKNTYLNLINTFIGTWNNESYRGDPRCFNGKIDEFSIRKRKMNEEELALSYDVGLPK